MRNMLRFTQPVLEPHGARNQCKLIWDSSAGSLHKGPLLKGPSKGPSSIQKGATSISLKKGSLSSLQKEPLSLQKGSVLLQKDSVSVSDDPESQNVHGSQTSARRTSLVAERISFYEDRDEPMEQSSSKTCIKDGQAKQSSAQLSPKSHKNGQTKTATKHISGKSSHSTEGSSAQISARSPAGDQSEKSSAQAKIVFDDHATTTFEYEAEDTALETYLAEHPEERDEILKQESEEHEFIHGVTENLEDLVHDTPHAPEHDTAIKTNTVIGISAGALTNYKSKMQVPEFVFGMTSEPAEEYSREPELEQPDPDSMNLLPADDNDLDAFSAETGKADMLF